MEAGAVLAPCFEPSGVAGVFVGFYWGRGAVTLLAFILHCDFWVGLWDFFLLLLLLVCILGLGSCSQEHQDPVDLGLLAPQ